MPPAQHEAPMPRGASVLLVATSFAATLALAGAIATLPRGLDGTDLAIAMGAMAFAACAMFFLQTRSMTLPWNGERLAIHPDEAVLLVVLYFLPSGSAIVVAAVATLIAQTFLQKPAAKAAFNTSVVTISALLATLAFAGLRAAGLSTSASVAVVPFVFSASNQLLVGLMLTAVGRKPLHTAVRAQLGRSILVAGSSGLIMGGLTIVFLEVHWLLLTAVAAVGFVFYKAMASEYRHESELAARRALNGAMVRLAGHHEEEDIIEAVYDACREAFNLRAFEVTIHHPDRAPRTWLLSAGPVNVGPISLVRAPLVTATGARVGELVLTVGARGRERLKEDEELASVFAGYLAAAVGQAEALRLLAEAKQRLKDAFDAAPDPILVLQRDGRLVHANPAAHRAFEIPEEPRDVTPFLPGEAAHAAMHPPETGSTTVQVETRGGRHCEFAVSRLKLDGGADGAILVGRDVTDRLLAEQEAARQRELMSRNERLASLGTLVAGVAHEVNNPLTFMEGHLELAIDDLKAVEGRTDLPIDPSEMRKGLETVLLGARRIEFISKGLRVIGRQTPATQEPVSVNSVAQEVAALVAPSLPAHIRLLIDLDTRDPVVMGDAAELQQVLLNLVQNAIEATPDRGGHVFLQTTSQGEHAEIVVSDEGRGISEEERGRLFTPFYTTKVDGTGLGLPIVHSIVRAHHGEVLVESPNGRGATFRVRLPRRKAQLVR